MRLDLYEFETAEGVSEDGASAGTDVSGGGEAVSPEVSGAAEASPEAEEPSPQASAEIDWDSDEVQERLGVIADQRLQAHLDSLKPEEEQAGPPQVDPFSDDYESQLAARDNWLLEQAEQRFLARQEEQRQIEAGEAQLKETFAGFKGQIDGFDPEKHTQAARIIAEELFLPDAVQRYGNSRAAATEATRKGAEYIGNIVKSERVAAVEEYKQSLSGDGDQATPYEPGVRGAALGIEGEPRDEMDVIRLRYQQTPA